MAKMKAAIFVEPGRIVLDDKDIPDVGPLDALMRVTTTTICGTDVHILKGEYPVAKGLTIGHEPVGQQRGSGRREAEGSRDRLRCGTGTRRQRDLYRRWGRSGRGRSDRDRDHRR